MSIEETYKCLHNPYKIVGMFEEEVAHYTGAPYAVAVDSCTNALMLCCRYLGVEKVEIPSKTYLSVPQAIIHAGGKVVFNKNYNDWEGMYKLHPYPIYDAAKRFTSNLYIQASFMCLSFHVKKHLNIGKGGMILTESQDAVTWFKRARYEGRGECLYHDDYIDMMGWNMYMSPQDAARGLMLMQNIEMHNPDLIERDGYKELTEFPVFKYCEVKG